MSDRLPARDATRRSMRAGARPAWPMSCAIPSEHPDAIIPDLSKPDPVVNFTKDDVAFVYGSRWKQRYFKKVGDDYFPLPAQWDVTHQTWRALFRPQQRRLVGDALSARQFPAPDRPALRRLSFRELRHQHQDRHRVECRLREVPRAGRGACQKAGPRQHSQPGAPRLCARQRHLHPVPFAGPAARPTRSRANITIGRSASTSART